MADVSIRDLGNKGGDVVDPIALRRDIDCVVNSSL
jgi:hypothetical protein